jgi:hypothetical protein
LWKAAIAGSIVEPTHRGRRELLPCLYTGARIFQILFSKFYSYEEFSIISRQPGGHSEQTPPGNGFLKRSDFLVDPVLGPMDGKEDISLYLTVITCYLYVFWRDGKHGA